MEYEDYEDLNEELNEDELQPLSPEEQELIETDYTVPYSEDPVGQVVYLFDRYFQLKKLEPEIEYDEQMRDYAMGVIRSVMADIEVPTDDLFHLLYFVLIVEYNQQKDAKDEIFTDDDSLSMRIKEYLDENPDLFCEPEIYDFLLNMEGDIQDTPTYKRILGMCYEDVMASGTIASLEAMLQLYNEKKPLSDQYISQVEIPSDSLEEFREAFRLLTTNPRQEAPIKSRFKELKNIIQSKYSEDEELGAWAAAQQQAEDEATAKKYKLMKWVSLAVAVLLVFLTGFLGIILLIVWGVAFNVPAVRDKIKVLREGYEAVEKTKNK